MLLMMMMMIMNDDVDDDDDDDGDDDDVGGGDDDGDDDDDDDGEHRGHPCLGRATTSTCGMFCASSRRARASPKWSTQGMPTSWPVSEDS